MDVGDDRIYQLRAEVVRRREDLITSTRRRKAASEMAAHYRVHEDFVLGFMEDVLGLARTPTAEEVERAERITHRDLPRAEE